MLQHLKILSLLGTTKWITKWNCGQRADRKRIKWVQLPDRKCRGGLRGQVGCQEKGVRGWKPKKSVASASSFIVHWFEHMCFVKKWITLIWNYFQKHYQQGIKCYMLHVALHVTSWPYNAFFSKQISDVIQKQAPSKCWYCQNWLVKLKQVKLLNNIWQFVLILGQSFGQPNIFDKRIILLIYHQIMSLTHFVNNTLH